MGVRSTVDVRNLDVRISAFSKIVWFPKRPDLRRFVWNPAVQKHLITGRLCPVFRRLQFQTCPVCQTGRPVFGHLLYYLQIIGITKFWYFFNRLSLFKFNLNANSYLIFKNRPIVVFFLLRLKYYVYVQ